MIVFLSQFLPILVIFSGLWLSWAERQLCCGAVADSSGTTIEKEKNKENSEFQANTHWLA